MNHCRRFHYEVSQQPTTLTRHRKLPIENRSCAGLWAITTKHNEKENAVGKKSFTCNTLFQLFDNVMLLQ